MTLAPCHTVRRPEVEGVTTATLEFGTVMLDMTNEPLLIAIGIPVRDRRIWTVTTCTNISEADLDMGGGLVTILIEPEGDRKSTRLNSSHVAISYAVFCLKKRSISMFTS